MHGLYKQNNLPYLNVKLCPNCKKLVPLNEEVCPTCEYNFTSKNIKKDILKEEVKEPTVNETLAKTVKKEEIKPAEKFVYCDNCGAKIIGSQKYCGGCGAKVSKRICPSCNQIVDSHLVFCPLCGEKLQEPLQQQFQPQQTSPIFTAPIINEKPVVEEKPVEVKQEPQNVEKVNLTNDDDVILSAKEELDDTPLNEVVNLGRKRLFVILQLLVVALIAAIMVAVPILTSEFFVSEMWNCFKGESTETLISVKSLFVYFKDTVDFKIFEVNPSVLKPMLASETGKLLFSDVSFINPLLLKLTDDPKFFVVQSAYISTLSVYMCLIASMLIVVFTSIINLFTKKPLKGKSLGLFTIVLFVSVLFVFTLNTFFNDFEKYDSWLTYAFLLSFIMWMIIKLVFIKENRKYKRIKKQLKANKE